MLVGGQPRTVPVAPETFTRLTTANPDALLVLTQREATIDVGGLRYVVARAEAVA